jgi:hypothetical protein
MIYLGTATPNTRQSLNLPLEGSVGSYNNEDSLSSSIPISSAKGKRFKEVLKAKDALELEKLLSSANCKIQESDK